MNQDEIRASAEFNPDWDVTRDGAGNPVTVRVWDMSGGGAVQIECDVAAISANSVELSFAKAPATASIRVVVVG